MTVVVSPPALKRCYQCGVIYPADVDHFYADKTRRCGLQSRCRDCHRAAVRENSRRYRAAVRKLKEVMRPIRELARMQDRAERRVERRKALHAYQHAYTRSPRGRLIQRRSRLRYVLRHESDPARRERFRAQLEACEQELRCVEEKQETKKEMSSP